jgi:predicted transcriptional regulator
MRNRTYHTPMNLLLEPDMYQRLRMIARLQKTTMSKIIRDGIKKELDRIDKENNAVIGGQQ